MNTDMHHNRNRVCHQFDESVREFGSSQKATVYLLNTLRLPDNPVNFPLTSHKTPLFQSVDLVLKKTDQYTADSVPAGVETGGSGLRQVLQDSRYVPRITMKWMSIKRLCAVGRQQIFFGHFGSNTMLKSRFRKTFAYALGAAALMSVSSQAQALTFVLTFTAGTSAQAQAGFQAAANRWSSIFSDNATVNLTVGTAALGAGILGQAASVRTSYSYAAFKTALTGDITSASDATAVANLDPGNSFGMLINRTSDNPNGSGSATPYLDLAGANNQTIDLTNANAKALGLAPALGTTSLCVGNCDAGIQFSSNFAFDYDPSDGITGGQYDFIGIATHEIGHALGFVSGVDVLDGNSPPVNGPFTANQFTFVSSLDMFRYSTLSASQPGGVIDWTADTRAKCFSIDGGTTLGACFSTGPNFGDGQQASHWKDSLGLGIMDPTAGAGELLSVSANDRMAFDVIGWNLAVAAPAVPEPGTWMMMLAGFGLVGGAVRRRRSTQIAALA